MPLAPCWLVMIDVMRDDSTLAVATLLDPGLVLPAIALAQDPMAEPVLANISAVDDAYQLGVNLIIYGMSH